MWWLPRLQRSLWWDGLCQTPPLPRTAEMSTQPRVSAERVAVWWWRRLQGWIRREGKEGWSLLTFVLRKLFKKKEVIWRKCFVGTRTVWLHQWSAENTSGSVETADSASLCPGDVMDKMTVTTVQMKTNVSVGGLSQSKPPLHSMKSNNVTVVAYRQPEEMPISSVPVWYWWVCGPWPGV